MLHQMILNADGRRRAPSMVGYASAAHHQRESYTSEKQVVEYISNSQSPRIISSSSSNYSPKKATNNYKERPEAHSPGSPFLVPWMSSPRKSSSSSSPNYYDGNYKPSERFHGTQDYYHGKSNNNREENDQYYKAGRGEADNYYHSDDDDDYEEHDYDDHNVRAGKNNRVSFRDDYNSRMVKADYDNKGGNDKSSYYDQQGSYRTRDEGKYYEDRNEYSSPARSNNKPKKETTYYELPSHGSPKIGSSGLAPIKTRPNSSNPNNRVMEYYPNNGVVHRMDPTQQKPANIKYSSSPKSKDEETIDSNEARRRYASSKSSPWAQHVAEESYTHTIDSREAARRYNGVFVP